jgi:protein TonB
MKYTAIFFLLSCCAGISQAQIRVTEAEAKQAATVKTVPEYPAIARQLRLTGKVEMEVSIDASGAIQEVKTVSGNPVLAKSCAKALSDWKFKAIVRDGKPTAAVAPLSFEFR